MPTPEEITFTIKKDGTFEYTIHGIKGDGCENISELFESLGSIESSKKTSEFYEKETDVQVYQKQSK